MIDFSSIPRRSVLGRVLRAPLRLLPGDATVRVLQGPLRGARWIAGSSTHGCWLGSYERGKQKLFADLVSAGMVVFDVGANVGFYTLLASRGVGPDGTVVAFEPVPRNLALLRKHVAQNRCTNVRVLDVAVSNRPGESAFSQGPGHSEGFLSAAGDLRVKVDTLDRLVDSGRIPAPDIIKIDVEGAELDVLKGARSVLARSFPEILVATHGDDLRRDCLAFLQSAGYSVRAIDDGSLDAADEFIATRRSQPGPALVVQSSRWP